MEKASPKLAWLLRTLSSNPDSPQKVAASFLRVPQDADESLQRTICDRFGIMPDVINGETSTNETGSEQPPAAYQ
jgi:hypothetical protein